MANDVTLPVTGTGTPDVVQATDEIAGKHYPLAKLVSGTEDSTERIGGDAANGLDVDVTRSALPTGAATSAKQDTGNTSLSSIDGKVLTDTQLRATPVPVSGTITASGAATEVTLALIKAKTDNLDVALSTRTKPADTQKVDGSAVTQPVSGTFFQATQPVSAVALPLPAGAATSAKQDTGNTSLGSIDTNVATRLSESDFDTKAGSLTESAPASDTASSGLNGRLQRIAQRLTSLIALLPAALVGGRLDANTGSWLGSTTPTVGQKTMAASIPTVIASDQSAVPISGTVTATGPLTDAQLRASAVPVSGPLTDAQLRASAVPVSAATLPLPTGAATEATQLLQATEATLAKLTQAQGAAFAALVGPMLQAVVSGNPSYFDGYLQPLTLTNDGRLRVSTSSQMAMHSGDGREDTRWDVPESENRAATYR